MPALLEKDQLRLWVPLCKVDTDKRLVYGYAATPGQDWDGENLPLAVLKEALPDYEKFGNIREMHQLSAVGVLQESELRDDGYYICAKIVDDNAWKKVKAGVYKGFSIGGKKKVAFDGTMEKVILSEISLVDRPNQPSSLIECWKSVGGEMQKAADTKKPYGDVEYADSGLQSDKKKRCPIDTPEHIKAAWNYIHQKRNAGKYSAASAKLVIQKIESAWKAKIDKAGPPSASDKDGMKKLAKGLYQIGDLSSILQSLYYLCQSVNYEQEGEGDLDSKIPEKLKVAFVALADALSELQREEVSEALECLGIEEDAESLTKGIAMTAEELKQLESLQKTVAELQKAAADGVKADKKKKADEAMAYAKKLAKAAEEEGGPEGDVESKPDVPAHALNDAAKAVDSASGMADNSAMAKVTGEVAELKALLAKMAASPALLPGQGKAPLTAMDKAADLVGGAGDESPMAQLKKAVDSITPKSTDAERLEAWKNLYKAGNPDIAELMAKGIGLSAPGSGMIAASNI